jgi:hypothetical protein
MFLNMLYIKVRQHDNYNPFKETMADVEKNPFYELINVDQLRQAKIGQLRDNLSPNSDRK